MPQKQTKRVASGKQVLDQPFLETAWAHAVKVTYGWDCTLCGASNEFTIDPEAIADLRRVIPRECGECKQALRVEMESV